MKNNIILLLAFICGINTLEAQTLDLPLITVNESQTAYAEVDEIHFSLIIRSHSEEIQDARNKNRKISESVFAYLEKKGIPKKYIQTKQMRISRNYITQRPPRQYKGFNAYQEIYVCLQEIDTYDEIVDALLLLDIADLRGPTFKSTSYEETLKKARLDALKKARISAEQMAAALGQKIGKAKLIQTTYSNPSNSAYTSSGRQGNNGSSGQASFEIGEIEVRASVQVSFELLD